MTSINQSEARNARRKIRSELAELETDRTRQLRLADLRKLQAASMKLEIAINAYGEKRPGSEMTRRAKICAKATTTEIEWELNET